MNFYEYLRSRRDENSPIGDLAQDVMGDSKFPKDSLDSEQINYLRFESTHDVRQTVNKAAEEYYSTIISS